MFKMRLLAIAVIVLSVTPVFAKEKEQVKVEIVAPSEDRAVRYQNGGLIGAIQGVKTADVVFMVNAQINGDHARLKCAEGHRGCTALGPGAYDGEISGSDVWITIELPVTHKTVRDHWKVSGTW
jgi:hypothetical protein